MTASLHASYDSTTKIISAAIAVVLLFVSLVVHNIPIASLCVLLLIAAYAYSPRAYSVSNGAIIVRRLIGNARFPLDAVREVRRATASDFQGCLRLFGNGGLFGYYGLFETTTLGKSTWYLTNRKNAVVVATSAKTALFSPDDVDGFIAAIPSLPGVIAPQNQPLPGSRQGHGIGLNLGIAVGVLGLSFAAFAVLYSPGPPSFTLTPEALTIHDRFYPVTLNAKDIDVPHIRVIDFAVDADWRPVARTNGFANSHYESGWFRVAGGASVRMYRAGGHRLVLIPPNGQGNAVLLEARDPEQFVEDLKKQWSNRS